MRAYVITDNIETADDVGDITNIVGVASSRKKAIAGCETYLGGGEAGVIEWSDQNKHSGSATLDDHTVTYEMFFVD